jgi:hypothetical protein
MGFGVGVGSLIGTPWWRCVAIVEKQSTMNFLRSLPCGDFWPENRHQLSMRIA